MSFRPFLIGPTLPDSNYANAQLRAYMTEMLKYWLREFDLDGFRCDVAGDVPTDFWESARVELTKDQTRHRHDRRGKQAGTAAESFRTRLRLAIPLHADRRLRIRPFPPLHLSMPGRAIAPGIPKGALEMRFSDDHDEKRAIVRFGERGALAASALVFTMDGVPMLYNGMEVGDTTESGAPALFENLQVFWPIAERRPNFSRSTKPSSLCAKRILRSSKVKQNGSPTPTLHAC